MRSSRSRLKPGTSWQRFFCETYQCNAALMGVVRHAVNKSSGKSGCIGNSSLRPHAAKWIESRMRGTLGCWFVDAGSVGVECWCCGVPMPEVGVERPLLFRRLACWIADKDGGSTPVDSWGSGCLLFWWVSGGWAGGGVLVEPDNDGLWALVWLDSFRWRS